MNKKLTLLIIFILFQLQFCDNPLAVDQNRKTNYNEYMILGQILYPDGEPAPNVQVYFSNYIYTFAINPSTFKDTLITDENGYYFLDTLTYLSEYSIVPIKYVDISSNYYSYICNRKVFDFEKYDSTYSIDDIYLVPVCENNSISGTIIFRESQNPASDALIKLYQLFCNFKIVDSTRTNEAGNYSFYDVPTGTYRISASDYDSCLTSRVVATSGKFYCDDNDRINLPTLELDYMMVYKPVIYIYPEEATQFQVNLEMKDGISLYESIPEYNNTWVVYIEVSGRIDGIYNYLFYEVLFSGISDLYYGYCISRDNINEDLERILENIGFSKNEIADFIEYWKNKLTDYDYYKVYPILNESLNQFVELNIIPQPRNMLRAWFFFEGCDNYKYMNSPQIESVNRDRTLVVEWGGCIIK